MNKFTKELCHHGILGRNGGIRRFQPYPKGYHGDGKFTGEVSQPKNLVNQNNINQIKKYKMAIIGEIHNRDMIKYYDKLLAAKKPEYFICEFADTDRCYTKEQLEDRMKHATNGAVGGTGADYQYNYWCYDLAHKHGCKLIGCNPPHENTGRMQDEDAVREKYMLDVLKEFEGKNAVVQLGDHHLRSIPIDDGFLKYCGDEVDDRGVVTDLTVENASPIWEYFSNKKDTCISRVSDEYKNEVDYQKTLKHSAELYHYGIKGMKWGVRRYQNPDGTLTAEGRKRTQLIRKTGNAMKTTKDANEIVKSLTPKEKKFLGAPKYDEWIEPEFDAETSSNVAKRFVQYEMKGSMKTPVSFLEIWDDGGTVGQIAIATKSGDEYRGKGYASKSVQQGLDWYNRYGYKKLERLEWIAAKDNTASNNLAKKFGFQPAKWEDYDWADQPKDNLYVYEKDTPKAKVEKLSKDMSSIGYKNFDKLKSHDEVAKTKKGDCHSQVMYEMEELKKLGVDPKAKFFIEYNPKNNQGGQTHSFVYYKDPDTGKTVWFENAWGTQKGVHEYSNEQEMIRDIKRKHKAEQTDDRKQYTNVQWAQFNPDDHDPGESLQELVNKCLK